MSTLFERFQKYAKEKFGCEVIEVDKDDERRITLDNIFFDETALDMNKEMNYTFNEIDEKQNDDLYFCFKISSCSDYAA